MADGNDSDPHRCTDARNQPAEFNRTLFSALVEKRRWTRFRGADFGRCGQGYETSLPVIGRCAPIVYRTAYRVGWAVNGLDVRHAGSPFCVTIERRRSARPWRLVDGAEVLKASVRVVPTGGGGWGDPCARTRIPFAARG